MELIKVQGIKTVDVANGLLKTELPPSTGKESELPALDEWELVLASGGEPAVCW